MFTFSTFDLAVITLRSEKPAAKPNEVSTFVRNVSRVILHIFTFSSSDLAVTPVLSEKLAAKPYEVSTFVRNVSRDFGQKMHFAL